MVSITQIKLSFLFILITLLTHAQVLNVDRENGQDSTKKQFLASFTGSFSSDKQKNKFVEFSNSTELDYIFKNIIS
jgi:hypothetical protein